MNNDERIQLITERLNQALTPEALEIIDESQYHVGHPGAQSGAGHFAVTISSKAFEDKGLVDCHRMVYDAVGDAMHTEIHALKINIKRG